MVSDADLKHFSELLSVVYKNPETKKVKLPAPEPYTVEVEESFLEEYEDRQEKRSIVHRSSIATISACLCGALAAAALGYGQAMLLPHYYTGISGKAVALLLTIAIAGGVLCGLLFFLLKPREFAEETEWESIIRQRPVKKKTSVKIGESDYPEKTIYVHKVREIKDERKQTADQGPRPHYIVFSGLAWVAAAVLGASVFFVPPSLPAALYAAVFWAAGVFTASGFILFYYLRKHKRRNAEKTIEITNWQPYTEEKSIEVDPGYAPRYENRIIANNEKITRLGRVEFDFEAFCLNESILVADGEGLTGGAAISYPFVQQAEKAGQLYGELEEITEGLPAVLAGTPGKAFPTGEMTSFGDQVLLRGEESRIIEIFQEIGDIYKNSDTAHLNPNLIATDHPVTSMLQPADDPSAGQCRQNAGLQKLMDIVSREISNQVTEIGRNFIDQWRMNNAILSGVRFESLYNGVSPAIIEFGQISHYASFNFYCPACNADKIKNLQSRNYSVAGAEDNIPIGFSANSRCRYDVESGKWICQACEREIEKPIPMHKLMDEVLYPTYDRLIEENKHARYDLDNKTRDDELSYTNEMDKEITQILGDLNTDKFKITNDIEIVHSEIDGNRKAIESLQQIIGEYKLQQSKALTKITDNSKDLAERIQSDTEKTIANLDIAKEKLVAEYEAAMDQLSISKKQEDMIRDSVQMDILNNMERTRAASEQAVEHLGNIEHSTARSAEANEQAVQKLSSIENHTARTASATEQSAAHLNKIENHTAKTAEGIGQLGKQMEQGNAIQAAVANKQGVDVHDSAWFRVDKNIPKLFSNVASDITGQSSVERAKRVGRAVK